MSVINQMLQDLDKRAPKAEQQTVFTTHSLSQREHAPYLIWVMLSLLLVALVVIGYLLGGHFQSKAQMQPAQVASSQITESPSAVTIPEKVAPAQTRIQVTASGDADETETVNETSPVQLAAKPAAAPSEPAIADEPVAEVQVSETTATPQREVVTERPLPEPIRVKPLQLTAAQSYTPTPADEPQYPSQAQTQPAEPEITATVTNGEPQQENNQSEATLSIRPVTLSKTQSAALEIEKGNKAKHSGEMSQAIAHFIQALRIDPASREGRKELAALQYGMGDDTAAITTLHQGVQISPDEPLFRQLLARIYWQKNQVDQAYYTLNPLRPPLSEQLDYYAMLGALAQKTGNVDTARETYQQLSHYQPQKAQWWLGLAIAQENSHLDSEALSSYQNAQQLGQLSDGSRRYIEQRLAALKMSNNATGQQ